MLRLGDPREGNKMPLDKKLRDPKKMINKQMQDLTKRMGGLITSQPSHFCEDTSG